MISDVIDLDTIQHRMVDDVPRTEPLNAKPLNSKPLNDDENINHSHWSLSH